jgi:glycosyltransferase involved in cell wall biosynthesis
VPRARSERRSFGGDGAGGDLRVALVHDWMANPGGGEKVLLALHDLWPDAPMFTGAYARERYPEFEGLDVRLAPLVRSALATKRHQLFTVPRALGFRALDLGEYDVVISSCSAESKYVRTGDSLHVCYCLTPTRYYWSDYHWYVDNFPMHRLRGLVRIMLPLLVRPLRRLDYASAQRVDRFVAISRNVQDRIRRYYGRDSAIIYPPVAVERYSVDRAPEAYFVFAGRHVAYKRLDLAVDAFNLLGLPLKVAGTGEETRVAQGRAKKNIEFLGRVSDAELRQLFRGARALIFPGEEDFGIVPVEAMASGVPVIAYGRGGALETVVDSVTGVLFHEQTPEALARAVRTFDDAQFDPSVLHAHAEPFGEERFAAEMSAFVRDAHEEHVQAKGSRH